MVSALPFNWSCSLWLLQWRKEKGGEEGKPTPIGQSNVALLCLPPF